MSVILIDKVVPGIGTIEERVHVCGTCADALTRKGVSDEAIAEKIGWQAEDRYCAGAYAGHYCDAHWKTSGFRKDLPDIIGGCTEDEIEAFDYRSDF